MVTESSRARCPAAGRAGDPDLDARADGRVARDVVGDDLVHQGLGRAPVVDVRVPVTDDAPLPDRPRTGRTADASHPHGDVSWAPRGRRGPRGNAYVADELHAEAEQVRPPARYAPPCPLNSVGDLLRERASSQRPGVPSHAPDLREGGRAEPLGSGDRYAFVASLVCGSRCCRTDAGRGSHGHGRAQCPQGPEHPVLRRRRGADLQHVLRGRPHPAVRRWEPDRRREQDLVRHAGEQHPERGLGRSPS